MIEKYIQFAIDNFDSRNWELARWWINKIEYIDHNFLIHYESIWYWVWEDAPTWLWIPLHTLITSKPFIEAVTIGLNYQLGYVNSRKWASQDWITTQQAIAIRDNKLEEFITNLLWNQK